MRRRPAPVPRRLAGAVVAATLVLTASGCGGSETGTGERGYVTGNGAVRQVPAADREDPVELSGQDLTGKPLDLADLRGTPVVVVVWGAWCVDCRREAPLVSRLARELEGRAHFVGVDIRDPSSAQAQAYERSFDVPYPSFYSPGGEALLAFSGVLTPSSIPGFVVLDAEGRVAASIIGSLPSELTLTELVEDAGA